MTTPTPNDKVDPQPDGRPDPRATRFDEIVTVEKKCPSCLQLFMGPVWGTDHPEPAELPVSGYCPRCVDRMETTVAKAERQLKKSMRGVKDTAGPTGEAPVEPEPTEVSEALELELPTEEQ
ncbi:hypothetical protein LCGC14_1535270 [marine sediment metagenome]|uniref:Uncharacterized protein n=1 Tax=marine sediment metagenome TaxID=412755 RepID=A0A0F9IUS9_9ZZZZ